jgi:xanthine dehydrogenase accessory factor
MMPAAMSRRAQELAAQGVAFVTATVVRAQRPTSVEAGNVALVLGDGTIEGFVGGACAGHSVRAYSLEAMQSGEAVLLKILPFADEAEADPAGAEVAREDGAVTVQNPCLSGGAIEVFLEPVLPAPRVLVVGDTPVAGAVMRIGAELGLALVGVDDDVLDPRPDDLALVVAAQGRDELHALRRGLESGMPYVGLVASSRRGDGVIGELRGDGVSEALLARIDVPAGIDIGARTPVEVALSILAKIVAVRRGEPAVALRRARTVAPTGALPSASATIAVDPVCGMTVAAVASAPSAQRDGETVYFCGEGCKAVFKLQHEHAGAG